jgi:plastocyanin
MLISAIALMVGLAGCGGAAGGYGTNPGTNPGGTNPGGSNPVVNGTTVSLMDNNSFSPSNLGISAGQTVIWKWGQCTGDGYSTCTSHNVTFDDGTNIHSETQSSGEFSRTFAAPGTYKYHCTIHGASMAGQVVVQ